MTRRSRLHGVGALLATAALLVGCTSAPDRSPEADRELVPDAGETAPSPFSWRSEGGPHPGFDDAALRAIARGARDAGSSCFLVTRGDAVVGEWYWRDGAPDVAREVYSVTKAVTSTLVGRAQAEGLLDVEDSAADYVAAWRDGPAAEVRLRNLLAGDSGRAWAVGPDYALIGARNRTRYAVARPQQHPPGEVWTYNNSAIQALDRVLRVATGRPTATYAEESLFEPLGMADTRLTGDSSGRSTSLSFGLNSTCRDLARFGLLIAQDGSGRASGSCPTAGSRRRRAPPRPTSTRRTAGCGGSTARVSSAGLWSSPGRPT